MPTRICRLSAVDSKTRRQSGRYQVTTDGVRLIDGVAFGKSYNKKLPRPPVHIPPLKLAYELISADEDTAAQAQPQTSSSMRSRPRLNEPSVKPIIRTSDATSNSDRQTSSRRRSVQFSPADEQVVVLSDDNDNDMDLDSEEDDEDFDADESEDDSEDDSEPEDTPSSDSDHSSDEESVASSGSSSSSSLLTSSSPSDSHSQPPPKVRRISTNDYSHNGDTGSPSLQADHYEAEQDSFCSGF